MTAPDNPVLSLRRVTRAGVPGPWHIEQNGPSVMTWCGRHVRGINRTTVPLSTSLADVEHLCPACKTAFRDGRPRPFRRGR